MCTGNSSLRTDHLTEVTQCHIEFRKFNFILLWIRCVLGLTGYEKLPGIFEALKILKDPTSSLGSLFFFAS